MKKEYLIETIIFLVLLAILIIPRVLYTDIIGHEVYHYYKHKDRAKEICMDFNKPYQAHIIVELENLDELTDDDIIKEEIMATRVGKIFTIVYLILALVFLNIMFRIIRRE